MMPQAAAVNSTPHATALRWGASAVVAGVPQTDPSSIRLDLGTWATGSAVDRLGRPGTLRAVLRGEPGPSPSPVMMGGSAPSSHRVAPCAATSRADRRESAECPSYGVDSDDRPWVAAPHGSFLAAWKTTAAHHRIIFTKFRCEIQCFGLTRAFQLDAADLFLLVSSTCLVVACILRLLGV